MDSILSFFFVALIQKSIAAINCYDEYSCAGTLVNQTDTDVPIRCRGYKSCFDCRATINDVGGTIQCDGSFACANSSLIYGSGEYVHCRGFRSCDNVDTIHNVYGAYRKIRCNGEQSCINTKMFTNTNDDKYNNPSRYSRVRCYAVLSCVNAIINTTFESQDGHYVDIDIHSYLAAYNATIISNGNTDIRFRSFYSVNCNLQCFDNGCNYLTLLCDDYQTLNSCDFEIDCEGAAKGDSCPDGYDGIHSIKALFDDQEEC